MAFFFYLLLFFIHHHHHHDARCNVCKIGVRYFPQSSSFFRPRGLYSSVSFDILCTSVASFGSFHVHEAPNSLSFMYSIVISFCNTQCRTKENYFGFFHLPGATLLKCPVLTTIYKHSDVFRDCASPF